MQNHYLQAYMFPEGHLQPQLSGMGPGEDVQTLGQGLPSAAVATPEARVLAQGAVQLKAQAQNFQVGLGL